MMLTQFVFGYGSLICSHSRALTSPECAHRGVTPVLAQGIERVWSKRSLRNMTAMGIQFNGDAETVGVLVPVSEQDIQAFDRREQGYGRHQLDLSHVTTVPFLNDEFYADPHHEVFLDAKETNSNDNVKIWVYVPKDSQPPTEEHPIVQSYVDTILRGCLNVGGEEFARSFIETTKGWHPEELSDQQSWADAIMNTPIASTVTPISITTPPPPLRQPMPPTRHVSPRRKGVAWIDDRNEPIYPRGDPTYMRENAHILDRLLRKYRPQHFQHRKRRPTLEEKGGL
jgi:hypothetical protein